MMRTLHVAIGWTLIVLGMVAGARVVGMIVPVEGVARFALVLVGAVAGAWIGWIGAGSPTLTIARERRFANLAELKAKAGEQGPLGDAGCAIGAARLHVLAKPETLRQGKGALVILGSGGAADESFLAAASTYPGALVFVDTSGFSARLSRDDVVRFAPGRADSARINPLLTIRRGPHAWRDCLILASGLVSADGEGQRDGQIVTALAVVLLDYLSTAEPAARTLDGVRRRLLDPDRAFGEIISAVHEQDANGVWQAHPEIARLRRISRADPDAALARLREAERALRIFQDGRLVEATGALDLRLADSASIGPRTIILEAPPGDGARFGPFFAAMLGQFVAALTDAVETDHWGQKKTRRVLLAIDDPAMLGDVPLLAQRIAVASRCGLDFLVRARAMKDAVRLTGDVDGYDAVVAIGPQDEASAEALSVRAGMIETIRLRPAQGGGWAGRFIPVVECVSDAVLATSALLRTPTHTAHFLLGDLKPNRGVAITLEEGAANVRLRAEPLPSVAHDWTGAAAPKAESAAKKLAAPETLPLLETHKAENPAGRLRVRLARGAKSRTK
jgi:hypothetical protein